MGEKLGIRLVFGIVHLAAWVLLLGGFWIELPKEKLLLQGVNLPAFSLVLLNLSDAVNRLWPVSGLIAITAGLMSTALTVWLTGKKGWSGLMSKVVFFFPFAMILVSVLAVVVPLLHAANPVP